MKLLEKFIYARDGTCLFSLNEQDDEKHKLIYGLVQTIKSFIAHFGKERDDSFITYSTETYQFSVLTVPTEYQFVIITTPSTKSPATPHDRILKQFYRDIYVELVVKNPIIKPGQKIESELFSEQSVKFFEQNLIY